MVTKKIDLISSFKSTFWVLRIIGLWPPGDDKLYTFRPYTLYSAIVFISIVIGHLASHYANIFFIYTDLELLASSLYIAIAQTSACVKFFCFASCIPRMKTIMKHLDSDWFQPRNGVQKTILLDYMVDWMRFYKIFFFLCISTNILWGVYPILDSIQYGLPFMCWYPFDHKRTPQYEIVYLYQMTATISITFINFGVDVILSGMMMHTAGQCEILCDELRNLYQYTKEDLETENNSRKEITDEMILKELNKSFLRCIEYHKFILSFVELGNTCTYWIAAAQFATSTFINCMTMFHFSAVKPFTSEFYSLVFYEIAVMCEILSYFWFGNQVVLASNEIAYSMFQSSWIHAPLSMKKNMVFFIRRSQKPIVYRALDFFDISLVSFVAILRSSYSYYALLRQVNE